MSALLFKLLIHLCVWNKVFQANGIQNIRYPTRFNSNQWRLSKRQDFLTKSRFLMWNPVLSHGQLYSNVKKPAIPLNFNRYGIQSPPIMAPIHQSYMFAIPTKINYASYQPIKDIEEKRKQENLHHITIINAIMPKPYLSTVPTHSHPTTSFQNYRTNNKKLYHQFFNNFGRQNMENLNQINAQQLQLKPQPQHLQLVYPSSPLALKVNKPTVEYINVKDYNAKNNNIEYEENEVNSPVSQCGRKLRDDTNNSASEVLYYYCNNRITNYKNPTQQQLISIQPTTTSTSTTTITSNSEDPTITTLKSSQTDFKSITTERPIFLPTPNGPLENSFVPITSTTILKNYISDSGSGDNFDLQRHTKYKHQRQPGSRYEDKKRQQQYTTTVATTYDSNKFHSFFTIEDAVTRAPESQVFNDPYQAYRHARRQQINHQRQTTSTTKNPNTITTTTKSKFRNFFDDLDDEDYPQSYRHGRRHHINHQRQTTSTTTKTPETTTIAKPKFKSFFDVLDDEDYIIPETHQYDYPLLNNPQKSVYYNSEFKSENQFPKHNTIKSHTQESTVETESSAVGEAFLGRPKIKEHHFGLFKSITPTAYSLPTVTTYKPNENIKELFLTTNKIPSLTSYNPKPITYTTTSFDTDLISQESEKENNTEHLSEARTTTIMPVTTTTEKKSVGNAFKPTSNLRSSTALKYLKQRRVHKPYKNLTSTTTKASTTLKKVPKYQRHYKTKKLKQFKHLYTTTSTTTTPPTTAAIPTTVESHTTRRTSVRQLPTTSFTSTEELTTKKAVFSKVLLSTELPKQKNSRQQSSLTTEATKRKKIQARTSTISTTTNNDSVIKTKSVRRGSKRVNATKNDKETTPVTITKTNSKNRRRLTTSSTTVKPFITRTSIGFISTSTFSQTTTPISLRSPSTTTTMKSIMRISNSKSRSKIHDDKKSQIRVSNDLNVNRQDIYGRAALKSTTSTAANIPPLPIEIYFKKSHNAKM